MSFLTRTFEVDDGVAVLLPDDSGFKPGDPIILVKVGWTIHVLHADAPEDEVNALLAMADTQP